MENTYRFLRRVEHRLQTMFDRQTHEMPRGLDEQRILAIRMGYQLASAWEDRAGPAQRFLADYRAKTELNRRILNHLLHDAFRDQRLKDPMHGGLRETDRLRERGDAAAVRLILTERADHRERSLEHADTGRIRRDRSVFFVRCLHSGLNYSIQRNLFDTACPCRYSTRSRRIAQYEER